MLERLFKETILDPEFRFKIEKVEILPRKSLRTGRKFNLIRVKIVTNNRPLLLGQFIYFPINGFRGFHPNYFLGFIYGHYEGTYHEKFLKNYELCLDVYEDKDAKVNVYKYVKLQDALSEGILSEKSDLYIVMKKYDLKYLLLAGSSISGPSLSMIIALEKILKEKKVNTVLDLFAGTGSLAKVALSNGVKKVTCVDMNPDVIKDNLGLLADRCVILKADAFKFVPKEVYDLALLDPFYDQCFEVASSLIPKLKENVNIFLFNIGRPEYKYWIEKIISELKKNFDKIDLLESWELESTIAICYNEGKYK
jgi:16S rRNA G966 N2-methylase RsmD